MSDCYLTLEEVKLNTSYLDGSIYKTYITHFFSYTKARHKVQYLYDENDNVHSVELYEIIDRKVDPDTNELFVRAEFEFEDDEDMDAFLHNRLYFKEPEWFHDLTHEEIVQLNCVYEQYEPVLASLIERKNVYINANGTVQIADKIYHLSEPKICEFFYEIKTHLIKQDIDIINVK